MQPLNTGLLDKLVAQGYSSYEIGNRLQAAPSTVRRRLKSLGLATVQRSGPRRKPWCCTNCGETDAAKAVRNRRSWYSHCRTCHNENERVRVRGNRAKVIAFLGGCCSRCGYNRCQAAFHLHHRDPSQKAPDFKTRRYRVFDKVKAELLKCDLICANCHAEIHWTEHA